MAADPVTLETIRLADIDSADRPALETLRTNIETVIDELRRKADLIRAKIENIIGAIPSERVAKFRQIRSTSASKRNTVSALDGKLREIASEIAGYQSQITELDATIASLEAQLATARDNKTRIEGLLATDNQSLTMLKDIFKFQWAELQAAIRLLGKINEKDTLETYDEAFRALVQSYIDVSSQPDFTFTPDSEVPSELPVDRLTDFKATNRDALGLTDPDDLNREWNSDLTISSEDELPGGPSSWRRNDGTGTGPTSGTTDTDEPSLPGAFASTSEGGRRRVSKKFRTDLARKIASSLKKKPLKPRRNH